MKIRHPWLLKILSFLGFVVIRLWMTTLHIRIRSAVRGFDAARPRRGRKYLFTFWHEDMLIPAHFMGPAYRILISRHADGELIAEICRLARASTIRGSTSRGSIEATRQMLHLRQDQHLVLVPDGPRGPRRSMKPGPVFLAARTGMEIVPVGIGYRRAWRLRTWDRFVLPRPFASVCVVLLPPLPIPADADKEQLETCRQFLEQQMHEAWLLAERSVHAPRVLSYPVSDSPPSLRNERDPDKMDKDPTRLPLAG